MYYKLYLDCLFVQQLLFNLYMLILIRKVLKCTATHFRMILGAVAGAAITCIFLVIPALPLAVRLYVSVLPANLCMLYLAFRCRKVMLFRAFMTASAGCFFAGSMISWLLRRTAIRKLPGGGGAVLLLCGAAVYYLLGFLAERLERKNSPICMVCIPVPEGGEEVRVKAFVDTGNSLIDPISKRPVNLISGHSAGVISAYMSAESYRAIPFRSVGREHGILNAYEIPVIYLEESGVRKKREHVLFAVSNTGIGEKNPCQIILHPGLIAD